MEKSSDYPVVKAEDMKLGDVVRPLFGDEVFSTATVRKIESDSVTLFRPYVHTSDVAYSDGILCYIGIEEYAVSRYGTGYYALLRRADPPIS